MVRMPNVPHRGSQNTSQHSSNKKRRVTVEEKEKFARRQSNSPLQSSPSVTSLLTLNNSVSSPSLLTVLLQR